MGFFNVENAKARLVSGFWDNFRGSIIIEIPYKCEFEGCPNYATDDHYFCKTHQREFENTINGKNPEGD